MGTQCPSTQPLSQHRAWAPGVGTEAAGRAPRREAATPSFSRPPSAGKAPEWDALPQGLMDLPCGHRVWKVTITPELIFEPCPLPSSLTVPRKVPRSWRHAAPE